MAVDWGKAMRPTVHDLVEATNDNTGYIEDTLPGLLEEKANVTALPHIEHGKASLAGEANANRVTTVTFNTSFNAVPNVTVTINSASPKSGAVCISAITQESFMIHLNYSTASTITVDWIAVG